MVEIAAMKKTDDEKVRQAKMAFIVAVGDLSWRLASVFLIPVFVGYIADQIKNTEHFVVVGVAVGFVLSVLFIIKLGLEANKK